MWKTKKKPFLSEHDILELYKYKSAQMKPRTTFWLFSSRKEKSYRILKKNNKRERGLEAHRSLAQCPVEAAGPAASRRLSTDTSSCSSPETRRQLHSLWERTICGSLSALREQGELALAVLTAAIIAPLYLTPRCALEPANQTLRCHMTSRGDSEQRLAVCYASSISGSEVITKVLFRSH